jgi:hypothetical protein
MNEQALACSGFLRLSFMIGWCSLILFRFARQLTAHRKHLHADCDEPV